MDMLLLITQPNRSYSASIMGSTCQQNQHTKILLVTLAFQGHLNPILRLGNSLVSKGLHVTLANTNHALKNLSTEAKSIGNIHLEFFSDGLPRDYDRKADIDQYMDTLNKFGPINLLALIRSHNQSKFSCIIYTAFLPWVADVAAEVGVPSAMLWIQSCTLYQIYHRYYNKLDEFPSQSNPNMSVKLPGLPSFRAEELPSFVLPTNNSRMLGGILDQVFHNMHKVKWVLGNTFMELEKDVMVSLNKDGHVFWPVGPIVPPTVFDKEDDIVFDLFKSDGKNDCLEWLNTQKPTSVVYISFGTLLFLSQKEIESIALGLKSTKQPFLWVIRTIESQQVPKLGILDEIKDQGLIVSWSPQTEVLSHPSVGCFLSHCGWNSLLESIAAGIPVIACPQWTDQPTNARMVTDVWGVGVKLMRNNSEEDFIISGGEIERCVQEVMNGPRSDDFKRNAMKLKTAARQAVSDGGSSDKNIQIFVDEVISSCSSYPEEC